ncbi:MFS transporter [Pseudonocardia sp. CA-107938]|uniref:MFS transporter n=1 Tax=Pseudonocardia sp. CA-107938 TaxID=3240021 RepID=UPI003D905FC0
MTDTLEPRSAGLARRDRLILLTLCAAQFMVALDFSVVTVALTAIGRDLDLTSTADVQWVMTAFVLPVAGTMLLFSRIGDRVGRRRLLTIGAAVVALASVVAGFAPNAGVLVAARVVQGVGSAMIGPTALALLTTSFAEGPTRDRALGINGAMLSLGFVVGTVGGGVLTQTLGWRSTMFLLALMCALVLVGAATVLPAGRVARSGAQLDLPGALLVTGGLVALVYAISTGEHAGWTSAPTLGAFAAAAVLLIGFVVVEGRQRDPLVPLGFLARRTIGAGAVVGFVTFGMCGGATVLLSLYMQDVLGLTALQTGSALIGEGVAAAAAGALAAGVIARLGTTRTLLVGLLVQAVSTAAMVALPDAGGLALVVVTSSVMGLGHVLAVVAFMTTMTSGLTAAEQGLAGGLAQTAQQIGTAVGVAVLATVAATAGTSPRAAELVGLHGGWLLAAVAVAAAAGVAAVFLRSPAAVPAGGLQAS